MWAYSFLFGSVVNASVDEGPGIVCPVTYADNWEVWCAQLRPLVRLLDPLAAFLSISSDGRKTLRECDFDGRPLPVVLTAKCLGADISYCRKVAASTRNKRVRAGGLRLVRLAGLPLSFHRRVSLVRESVWKQALHGAATGAVPKTVYKGLRTKLCRGLRVDRAGRSPWLVANALTKEPLDPEFEVLLDRLRLCRQLAGSLPEWRAMLPRLWQPGPGRYKGVTRRFVTQLSGLGWNSEGDGIFKDGYMEGPSMWLKRPSHIFVDSLKVLGLTRLSIIVYIEKGWSISHPLM